MTMVPATRASSLLVHQAHKSAITESRSRIVSLMTTVNPNTTLTMDWSFVTPTTLTPAAPVLLDDTVKRKVGASWTKRIMYARNGCRCIKQFAADKG